MKLLIVSWSILPRQGGSSVIIENLAKNFQADELVVLGSRRYSQSDLPKRDPSGPKFHYFFSELDFMGRGNRFFSWFRDLRFSALVKRIKSLIKSENIDHVIGVYPNASYCLAASIAAKELNIRFSSYFHNTYVENVEITDPKAEFIQSQIFNSSEHIFVMSKGMQRFYEQKYELSNIIPLVHTYNAKPDPAAITGAPGTEKEHYKLVAIGNFNESNMDATLRLTTAIMDNPKYSLSLFTHVPRILLKKRGLDPRSIDYEGFVDPDEVHDVLQNYDICILTHGFSGGYGEIEYKTIFPTRTIPLLLAGKPILAHSPKGSFLNDFLMENKCAELVDERSSSAIVDGLEKIAASKEYQKQLIDAAKKTAEQFYGPNVVRYFKEVLNSSLNRVE